MAKNKLMQLCDWMSKMTEDGMTRILLTFELFRRGESITCELDRFKARPTALAPRFDDLICNNITIDWEVVNNNDF